jgi:prepilin-type N-terminal cleavage/methylation domain-containing protein
MTLPYEHRGSATPAVGENRAVLREGRTIGLRIMPTTTCASRQAGFTLVEVVFALVIVGVLLVAVLKGEEMVAQARIKKVVGDLNGVAAAYFSYKDRYNAVPGDDSAAGGAGGRWQFYAALPGGGDGQVSGAYNDVPSSSGLTTVDNGQGESMNFWWHLRLAGLTYGPSEGPGAAVPPSGSVGGRIGVQTGALGLPSLVACASSVPDKIASAVDAQLDDQVPNRGAVRARDQGLGAAISAGSASTVAEASALYAETGVGQYVICMAL